MVDDSLNVLLYPRLWTILPLYYTIIGFTRVSDTPPSLSQSLAVPLMTVEKFSLLVGLEPGVVQAQADRGYWPTLRVGRRRFVNVEAVRIAAARRAEGYAL